MSAEIEALNDQHFTRHACISAVAFEQVVDSESGNGTYLVRHDSEHHKNKGVLFDWSCTCPDYTFRPHHECKHVRWVKRGWCGWQGSLQDDVPSVCPRCSSRALPMRPFLSAAPRHVDNLGVRPDIKMYGPGHSVPAALREAMREAGVLLWFDLLFVGTAPFDDTLIAMLNERERIVSHTTVTLGETTFHVLTVKM